MSLDVVLGGAVGRGGFVAAASNTIPLLRGKTWYIGLSVSGDLVEGLDLSGSWVTYSPISLQVTPYARADGTVDSARLYTDFLELPRFSGHMMAWDLWGTRVQSFVPVG
jgi:hypothetical protein